MATFDKKVENSFRKVKQDMFNLQKQILEISRKQNVFLDIVSKLQEVEGELIHDVEKADKNCVKKKKKVSKK